MPELICIRLFDAESPAGPLTDAVRTIHLGQSAAPVHVVDSVSFRQVPNAPFAYWVNEKLRRVFKELPAFESEDRTAKAGLCSGDDFRFVRCWWEVPFLDLASPNRKWWSFAKGGAYSPYYADLHLMVSWMAGGVDMQPLPGARVQNDSYYFRPGLTWTNATTKDFGCRVLPKDCIFGHMGPSAFFPDTTQCLAAIALLNSPQMRDLIALSLGLADTGRRHYEVGLINRTPMPTSLDQAQNLELYEAAKLIWRQKQLADSKSETSHVFVAPWFGKVPVSIAELKVNLTDSSNAWEAAINKSLATIGRIAAKIYGFVPPEVHIPLDSPGEDSEDGANAGQAEALFSYLFGCAIGRWSVKTASVDVSALLPNDPFAPIPLASPAALPLAEAQVYLVEEAGHPADALSATRAKMSVIWRGRSDTMEEELAIQLGVSALQDYISRPSGFFATHLSMYSRSRRQAPIYWPLATKSGSITIWVYYHRLDENTLPRLITEVLDPKLRQINEQLASMAGQSRGTARRSELEVLAMEVSEMKTAFQGLIDRGYRPNLNDGVLITACPLHEFFRLPKWQKELKACWKELERGDYDWAHLAMSIWPERVLKACAKDRSIAIAHGREDLCPAEAPTAKRVRKPKTTEPK